MKALSKKGKPLPIGGGFSLPIYRGGKRLTMDSVEKCREVDYNRATT
jgi:hypothetical protein